jgi:hypothetical protein
MEELSQELKDALKKLRGVVKHSTAMDEFLHLDLTLVSARQQDEYEAALITVNRAIKNGEFSLKDFDRSVFGKV